jgi:hypothetical protein
MHIYTKAGSQPLNRAVLSVLSAVVVIVWIVLKLTKEIVGDTELLNQTLAVLPILFVIPALTVVLLAAEILEAKSKANSIGFEIYDNKIVGFREGREIAFTGQDLLSNTKAIEELASGVIKELSGKLSLRPFILCTINSSKGDAIIKAGALNATVTCRNGIDAVPLNNVKTANIS